MTTPAPQETPPRAGRRRRGGVRRLGRWTVRLLVAPLLLLALAYPVAWFALNSPELLTRVLTSVNESIPGTIQVAELEWAPCPGACT